MYILRNSTSKESHVFFLFRDISHKLFKRETFDFVKHHLSLGVFQNQPTIFSQTQNQPLFFCHYYSSIKFSYYPYVFELFTKLPFLFNFLLISKLTKNQIHPNYFFLFTKMPSSSIFPTTMNHHFWALKPKNSIFNHFFSHSNPKNFISSHLLYISI